MMLDFQYYSEHGYYICIYIICTVLPAGSGFFSFLVKVANSAIISQVCVIES